MHVVFLARRAWPHIGGVERHLQNLSRALQQQRPDIKISIITEQYDRALPLSEELDDVNIYRFPLLPNQEHPDIKRSAWRGVRQLFPILQTADVIHVHDVFFWLLPSWLRLLNKKIFITFHGYEPPGPPNHRQRFWHQLAELLTEGNICIGGFHQKWYGVQPTITSFGAVDHIKPPELKLDPKTSTHKKQPYVFVGRLADDTGIWQYLYALASRREQGVSVPAVEIIGEGPLRQQLETFVKDNQLPVKFLGSKQVTVETYQKYSASLVSGYLSILESLAAGVPVISTYNSLLKKDYLTQTPFVQWITVAAPGAELTSVLDQSKPVSLTAQSWTIAQTWYLLAARYLTLWGLNT
jgi:glycosyltransferase involved in cell wall biosynthesis